MGRPKSDHPTTTAVNAGRRYWLKHTALAGGASALLGSLAPGLSAATSVLNSNEVTTMNTNNSNVKSKGYAAFDNSGELSAWEFERRPVGEHDVLIDIKFASICHSDIHQMKGHWGPQQYPQVPGHEIVGLVAAVGSKVTKFKVGDRAGVGCMVDGCSDCDHGEQYHPDTVFTYGYPQDSSPTGISQGGYATNIVVRDHYAVHIPETIRFQDAAPLLCAGVTTYSPLLKFDLKPGVSVGVAGIGGLGHLAVKLAASKGADVIAFTTSPEKVDDIKGFGAKDVVVVDGEESFSQYAGKLDCMISTIPYGFDVAGYASQVKPFGVFTQVGMPEQSEVTVNALGLAFSRVNFNASLIGDMQETQDVVNYCAEHKVLPQIQIINAEEINQAWAEVVAKTARYRYVIDASTI
ncbi:NAD(P)-dependent alcohol dehydrogenase [Halioxenophilus aromaticivorans]|uniref:NAD(P)-dependent alcohol dehydrogenase n=1 Tax=Halioxenophilus aromaticivorans TaxID=1306992 RepID=A0AAV3U5N8_9ALTE